jgi:tRNA nucleotidyltransferase/poly(A) polymerase
MIRKFKEQDIDFDYKEFLELMGEYNNILFRVKEGVSTPSKRNYKEEYKKFQSSTKSKKYRAELNKYNRDKGTYGNGDGKDASHKGGKIIGFETESKNRGRREKSRLKKK